MNSVTERDIVVRAFAETGKDHEPGFIEYINKLERLVVWQDKMLSCSPKRKSRKDIHKLIQWAEEIGELK